MADSSIYKDYSRSFQLIPSSTKRLSEVLAPLFSLIIKLRDSKNYGDSDSLRGRILALLRQGEQRALRLEIEPKDISDSRFAIVAFIDEVVRGSDWADKDSWVTDPLQLELYGHMEAGNEFFERLDRLKAEPKYRKHALEVYYLCMTLGFRGKYNDDGHGGRHKLRTLIDETHARLQSVSTSDVELLSPHGLPRDQKKEERKSRIPSWVVFAAASGVLLVAYLVLTFMMNNSVSSMCSSLANISQVESFCR